MRDRGNPPPPLAAPVWLMARSCDEQFRVFYCLGRQLEEHNASGMCEKKGLAGFAGGKIRNILANVLK
jgi:hypothetical protein